MAFSRASEPASAERRERPADAPSERPGQLRRGQRHADEQPERPARRATSSRGAGLRRRRRTGRSRAAPARGRRPTAITAVGGVPAGGSVAPSRTAAIGGTLVALCGGDAGDQRDDRARAHRDDDRPGLEHRAGLGHVEAQRRIRALSPFASPTPRPSPSAEASEPIRAPSTSTERQNLAARGAEGPQRRQLARALGHRDRQRVEDDERADEQRDRPERQQEGLDELRDRLRCPSPPPSPAPRRSAPGRSPAAAARSRRPGAPGETPGFGGDRDHVVAAGLPSSAVPLWGRRRRSSRRRAIDSPNFAMPAMRNCAPGPRPDADRVADLEPLLRGRAVVDHDLAGRAAQRPPVSFSGLKRVASGSKPKPNVGVSPSRAPCRRARPAWPSRRPTPGR